MKHILIHGLGQTEKSWDSVVENLNADDVHCPNLQSLLNSKTVTYDELYMNFQEYCNGFSESLNLCGLSLGGVLALNYTLDFPDKVNSLVLIGTQYKMPKVLLKLQGIIFRFMPNSLFDSMGFNKNDFIHLTNSMINLDMTNSLSKIICKSLIICGEKDSANKKATISLSKIIKNSKLIIIENSNHEVNVDNPNRLSQEINTFYHELKVI